MTKINKTFFLPLVFSSLLATQVSALSLDDFTHSIEVTTETTTDAPVLKITLPEDIYTYSKSSDLSDIRVFNAKMKIVPHKIMNQTLITTESTTAKRISFFPILNNQKPTLNQNLQIETTITGTIISSSTNEILSPTSYVSSYILDLSSFTTTPNTITINLSSKDNKDFNQSINIQQSSDLANWQTIIRNTPIINLRHLKKSINTTSIDLPQSTHKYLKIVWPLALKDVKIESIDSTTKAYITAQEKIHTKIFSTSQKLLDENNGIYTFQANGYWPTKNVNLELININTTIPGRLYSKLDKDSSWVLRGNTEFFKLNKSGEITSNKAIQVYGLAPRYWGLKPDNKDFDTDFLPKVVVDWTPKDLFLMASGEQPYTVAFGARGLDYQASSTTLLNYLNKGNNDDIVTAITSYINTHKIKPPPPEPEPEPEPFPWSKTIMWLALLLGVGVLGYMVRGLFKDMNNSNQ